MNNNIFFRQKIICWLGSRVKQKKRKNVRRKTYMKKSGDINHSRRQSDRSELARNSNRKVICKCISITCIYLSNSYLYNLDITCKYFSTHSSLTKYALKGHYRKETLIKIFGCDTHVFSIDKWMFLLSTQYIIHAFTLYVLLHIKQ